MTDVTTAYAQGPGGFYLTIDRSGPYAINSSGTATLIGSGGGGAAGSPSTNVLTTQGSGYKSAVVLTRTNDTNAYAAGDVIGSATGSTAALTFANIGPAGGGHVFITTVDLRIDLAAVISGMTSYRLHLYSATPPSALGDNAAWDLPAGDRSVYIGYVDFGTPEDFGSTLFVQPPNANKQFLVPAVGSLYGYLVTNGAFTPSASIVLTPTLRSVGV